MKPSTVIAEMESEERYLVGAIASSLTRSVEYAIARAKREGDSSVSGDAVQAQGPLFDVLLARLDAVRKYLDLLRQVE